MMHRRFEEMTTTDLRDGGDLSAAVAVVPIAAIEQHGPHLPLGTDAMIADGMVETLLPLLPDALAVTILPTVRIGKSTEHSRFAGTIDHGWRTATDSLLAICASLYASGFRRVAIVSSHGGNTPVMDIAALEARSISGLFVATSSWMRFGYPDAILPAAEIAAGIHGGAVETALMLHFRPDLVRLEALADFPSLQTDMEREHAHLRAHGRLGFGWLAEDLNAAGVVGDTRLATPEIGRAIAEHQARGCAAFLGDVAAFDLERLR